jgi:hypothetical protein
MLMINSLMFQTEITPNIDWFLKRRLPETESQIFSVSLPSLLSVLQEKVTSIYTSTVYTYMGRFLNPLSSACITGARMLYRYLPKSAGLRRITLHKSISSGDKMYLLLCECSNFLENLSAAALLLPALRARLCGYTGLYRTTASF